MQATPYINFNGKCREAMEFYRDVLDGEITSMFTYGNSPMADETPEDMQEKIMHARLVADGAEIMGADSPMLEETGTSTVHILLNVDEVEDADSIFDALSKNGDVKMEMQRTFWVERFGACVDRYGIGWMINAGKAAEMPAGSTAGSTPEPQVVL